MGNGSRPNPLCETEMLNPTEFLFYFEFQLFTSMLKKYSYLPKLQGDQSSCVKPPVDTKTHVAFQSKLLILKQNLCFDVNGRFDIT